MHSSPLESIVCYGEEELESPPIVSSVLNYLYPKLLVKTDTGFSSTIPVNLM